MSPVADFQATRPGDGPSQSHAPARIRAGRPGSRHHWALEGEVVATGMTPGRRPLNPPTRRT